MCNLGFPFLTFFYQAIYRLEVRGILSWLLGSLVVVKRGGTTAGSSSTLGKSRIKLSTHMYSNLGLSLLSHIWCADKHCVTHMAKIMHKHREATI